MAPRFRCAPTPSGKRDMVSGIRTPRSSASMSRPRARGRVPRPVRRNRRRHRHALTAGSGAARGRIHSAAGLARAGRAIHGAHNPVPSGEPLAAGSRKCGLNRGGLHLPGFAAPGLGVDLAAAGNGRLESFDFQREGEAWLDQVSSTDLSDRGAGTPHSEWILPVDLGGGATGGWAPVVAPDGFQPRGAIFGEGRPEEAASRPDDCQWAGLPRSG